MALVDLDMLVGSRLLSLVKLLISFRIWNGLSWIGIAVFYFPESQTRAHGTKASDILKKIDYLGGFLSIGGLTLL